ncbi:antiporter [Neptunicella sp.]|uniref:antiporter n=1 Tax=Neptunicella sp. TaxID=2125986 RepID=UPI003F691BD9
MSDLRNWLPDNNDFWHEQGQKIANRNLWISVLGLLCAFGIWMQWSVISVQMLNVGFPFEYDELFSLIAIAGFSGATLRIPSGFLVQLCGGRYTLFLTTSMLLLPSIGTAFALQRVDTPLWIFQLMSLLSGIGGGNFASSISNISFFYPKKEQPFVLSLHAGLGIFGIVVVQVLMPILMSYGIFSIFSGDPNFLVQPGGNILGSIQTGQPLWLQNTGFLWLLLLIPLIILLWFGSNNIHTPEITPTLPQFRLATTMIISVLAIGFIISFLGLWLVFPADMNGGGVQLPKEIVILLAIIGTIILLKIRLGHTGTDLDHHPRLLYNKHTWGLSLLHIMVFGSFIGYSASFPLTVEVIFGYTHVVSDGAIIHSLPNPNAPSVLTYTWIGPFIGILIRPLGSWLAEKIGGALVTLLSGMLMLICVLGIAYYMQNAYQSITPEEYFIPFFLLFLGLFAASGIGNGAVYNMLFIIYPPGRSRVALIWMSAIAAYGAFYIPMLLGEQIDAGTPERAMLVFAIFYILCTLVNGFLYLRKTAEFYNP